MHRWKLSALAAAAFVSAALTPTDASALALGRINVKSALGEPLRAEIDIPQATPAELEALKATIATPAVFQSHGVEYSASVRQVQIEVVRQPDGSAKLRLSSNGPVNDPFVDLVIDANWSAGQLVRSYTLLLDPPSAAQSALATTVTPAQARDAGPIAPASVTGRSYGSEGTAPTTPPRRATAAASGPQGDVTVRFGDTAGRIANSNRPAGVSLDQMLVAMLRANPNAFINGNVNRLRAGSVVQLPGKEEASATSAKEARQIVVAQSRDFNEFRRRMAAKASAAKVAAADRASSGQVQTQVQDQSAHAAAEDKLTLSKGAIQSQHAAEEQLAQSKQASAQSDRVDELQRNLAELQKVAAASDTPDAAPAATADAPVPGITVPLTPPAVLETPAADAAAPAASDTATAATGTPADTSDSTDKAPPAPAPSPDFLDEITPIALPAAGGIVVVVLGLLGWGLMKRRRAQAASAVATDSHPPLAPPLSDSDEPTADTLTDSAAPGAQENSDAVDPVAEAEVYLAYGRDVQAEEILQKALNTQPDRLDVQMKLAEIYAKRRDPKALETTALNVQSLTQSTGPHWERIVQWGLQVDSSNPLYHDQAEPTSSAFSDALAKSHGAAAPMAATASLTKHLPADLDLDLDLPGGLADTQSTKVDSAAAVTTPSESDFAALDPNWEAAPTKPTPATTPLKPLDLSTLDFSLETPSATTAQGAAHTLDTNLDLSALNLDLGDAPPAAAPTPTADDPLSTKLDLAREFHAIGDSEGARTLVEEVIAEASGDLKERAQRLLAEID